MAADDFESRLDVTKEFQLFGLGGSLARGAAVLMEAARDEELDQQERQSAAAYAAKTIMERAAWLALGVWIGYFEEMELVSGEERIFFKDHSELIQQDSLPDMLRAVRDYLAEQDAESDTIFLRRFTAGFSLARPMTEWYSSFQAALTVSEILSEGPVTTFLSFLQTGDANIFKEYEVDADQVMTALKVSRGRGFAFTDQKYPASVIAGFIRYTQYLSAMDDLFPSVAFDPSEDLLQPIITSIADREILLILFSQIRWRYPSDEKALERYTSVLIAFANFAGRQFHLHRALAVHWESQETMSQIFNLSQRFFFPFVPQDRGELAPEDPRDAILRRSRLEIIEERLRQIRAEDEGQQEFANFAN